jgi:SnoaL-like protein
MRALKWKMAGAAVVAAALTFAAGDALPSQAATPAGAERATAARGEAGWSGLPLTDRHLTSREKANLATVLRAYDAAEGKKLNVPAFEAVFTRNGVFNDVVGGKSYRGEALGDVLTNMAGILPDVHRELKQITVHGDVISIELSIQGTFTGSLPTPAGVLKGNGAKVDVPTADFFYLRNGKVEKFDCFVGNSVFLSQMGVNWDWAGAVGNN